MSSRKVRYYDSSTGTTKTEKFTFDKNKKYKWNKTTGAIEEATTLAADELTIAGSKSSLRRIGDLERNVSILASKAGVVAANNDDTDAVQKDSKRALDPDTPLSISGHTITLKRGDDSTVSVTVPDNNTTYSAGSGISLSGTTFSHSDTSTASSVNNSGNTFIQDITLDGFGHITALNSATVTVGNATQSIAAGNGLTGGGSFTANQTSNSTVTLNVVAGNGLTVTADSVAMSGSYTGTFTATGDICAYSDASLKTNVKTIEGALDKVAAVRGVTFDRIADGSTSAGVIAQELEAVLPEAVKTDEEGVKMVAYGNLTGLLIEAVKELSAQVEELKARK